MILSFLSAFLLVVPANAKRVDIQALVPKTQEKLITGPDLKCAGGTVVGRVTDTRRRLSVDLSSDLMKGQLSLEHTLDIDAHEDRCITGVTINVKNAKHDGCHLELRYQASPYRHGLFLVGGFFDADSFCPGWDNAVEGRYIWTGTSTVPELRLSKLAIDERTARTSCVDISALVSGDLMTGFHLGKSRLDFEGVLVQGSFQSRGSVTAVCKPKPTSAPVVQRVVVAAPTEITQILSLQYGWVSIPGHEFLGPEDAHSASSAGVDFLKKVGNQAAFGLTAGKFTTQYSDELLFSAHVQGVLVGEFLNGLFLDGNLGTISNGSNRGNIWTMGGTAGYRYVVSPTGLSFEAVAGGKVYLYSGLLYGGTDVRLSVGMGF